MNVYSLAITGLDADAVINSATAGKAMAELANTIPNSGGVKRSKIAKAASQSAPSFSSNSSSPTCLRSSSISAPSLFPIEIWRLPNHVQTH